MSSNMKAKSMNNNMGLAEYKPEPYDNMKLIRELEKMSEQPQVQPIQQYGENRGEDNYKTAPTPVYIFSPEMRDYLGFKESSNNYRIENKKGGGIGALGKYQLRSLGLQDIGYVRKDGSWTGKNNIYSKEDFFNNPQIQEEALDEFMKAQYRYLKACGAFNHLNKPIKGKKADFNVSETGALAAAHKEGQKYVCDYLKGLEQNPEGYYYMDYGKLTPDDRTHYEAVETRLREFEK